ncbi:hypothetical protein KC946_02095 [Candidatus Saccharibacteria bacterium]|nr:hypothetical protein [Candidatus Saccharibacteria bacterium]
MDIFDNLGKLPEEHHERHMPFPVAHVAGVLDGIVDFNSPQSAAQMVLNGSMPDKKGLINLNTSLAGYDFVGSYRLDKRECILPTIKTTVIDDQSRDFRDTGIITFTTEDGLIKPVGAIVEAKDADRARDYGRVFRISSNLSQLIFGFDRLPQFEIQDVGPEVITAKVRNKKY